MIGKMLVLASLACVTFVVVEALQTCYSWPKLKLMYLAERLAPLVGKMTSEEIRQLSNLAKRQETASRRELNQIVIEKTILAETIEARIFAIGGGK